MTQRQPDRSRGQVLLIAVAAMIVLDRDLGGRHRPRVLADAPSPGAGCRRPGRARRGPLHQRPGSADAGPDVRRDARLERRLPLRADERLLRSREHGACAAAGGTSMQVMWPPGPTAGSLAGDHGAVQVIITAQHPSFFGRIFGISTATVSTGAVAARQRGNTNNRSSAHRTQARRLRHGARARQLEHPYLSGRGLQRARRLRAGQLGIAGRTPPTTTAPRRRRDR